MSDLFHESVPLTFIGRVFETMRNCPQHVFQVLTKKKWKAVEVAPQLQWPENVWMGVSIEDKHALIESIICATLMPVCVFFRANRYLAHSET